MKKPIPTEVIENGWDFWRDTNEKLWALDIPVTEMKMSTLAWIFDLAFWEDEDGNLTITPAAVMREPWRHAAHMLRITEVDSAYPIDIMKNRKGRWMTLDGLHRLVQLKMAGQTTVRVRKVSRKYIPNIRTDL